MLEISENNLGPSPGLYSGYPKTSQPKLQNHRLHSGSNMQARKPSLLSGRPSSEFLFHTLKAFNSRFVFFLQETVLRYSEYFPKETGSVFIAVSMCCGNKHKYAHTSGLTSGKDMSA
jgi:hypothetical protein